MKFAVFHPHILPLKEGKVKAAPQQAAPQYVADLLWGPAAAAYYVVGAAFKSIQFNSDVLGRMSSAIKDRTIGRLRGHPAFPSADSAAGPPGRSWNGLGAASNLIRFTSGAGLMLGGTFTGNPFAAYFGITFMTLSAGEALGKCIYNGTSRLLGTAPATKLGGKIDRALRVAAERLHPNKETGAEIAAAGNSDDAEAKAGDAGKAEKPGRSRLEAFLMKAGNAIYTHRGEIAKTAIASLVSMGAMTGIAWGTESLMNNTLGAMAPATGQLTLTDKLRNTAVGAYRMYNLPVAAFQSGPEIRKFYLTMKAKYSPKSPEDWADIVENNITWTNHAELYGTTLYYVSSEEAATFRAYNGVMGYYSDCTGKGALLQNMLKMNGYGNSQIVVGVPPLGRAGAEGHIWVINPNASDPKHELFHYSNTQDLLYSQKLDGAQGIRGDRVAAFAAGGVGSVITELAYKGLEALGKRLDKFRDRGDPKAATASGAISPGQPASGQAPSPPQPPAAAS